AVSVAHELGQFGVVGVVAEPVDFVQGEVVGGHAGGHVQHSATANCGQLCPVTDHGHVRIVAVGQFQECSRGFLVYHAGFIDHELGGTGQVMWAVWSWWVKRFASGWVCFSWGQMVPLVVVVPPVAMSMEQLVYGKGIRPAAARSWGGFHRGGHGRRWPW